jgi:hypothetical protein
MNGDLRLSIVTTYQDLLHQMQQNMSEGYVPLCQPFTAPESFWVPMPGAAAPEPQVAWVSFKPQGAGLVQPVLVPGGMARRNG